MTETFRLIDPAQMISGRPDFDFAPVNPRKEATATTWTSKPQSYRPRPRGVTLNGACGDQRNRQEVCGNCDRSKIPPSRGGDHVAGRNAGPMRVLVTGGGLRRRQSHSASIGKRGYDLVVLDDLSAGQQRPVFPPGVRLVLGDFTDKATMTECLRGVDAVVHLAALAGVVDSVEDPRPSFQINVAGSFQLLELARAANVRSVINASTGGALLGEAASPISEEMAPCPLSPYGASKLAVEGYCSAFASAYGFSCVSLRFSNIYGRLAHKEAVAAFIRTSSASAARGLRRRQP